MKAAARKLSLPLRGTARRSLYEEILRPRAQSFKRVERMDDDLIESAVAKDAILPPPAGGVSREEFVFRIEMAGEEERTRFFSEAIYSFGEKNTKQAKEVFISLGVELYGKVAHKMATKEGFLQHDEPEAFWRRVRQIIALKMMADLPHEEQVKP
eukprot:TRINITY_DN13207_c0_g1_i1.p1 TRINITY_DN13207_c0_g1~~TRINITY_DN13207_c0_g1_i1.p1  ORF type:complete len:155 (+),score=28.66 TRINITY_DN13207_c0_g1_i1:37-501(+)